VLAPVPAGPGDGILFVGNSLTYGNDLPGLVEGLSAGTGADVAQSYSLAADDVGGSYFPVTHAWQLALQREPSLRLYSSDGFHPSEQGSYLAALVMVGVLTGRSPLGMPARVIRPAGTEVSIPQETASALQDAASATIAAYGRF
jgi:hypothetical protein